MAINFFVGRGSGFWDCPKLPSKDFNEWESTLFNYFIKPNKFPSPAEVLQKFHSEPPDRATFARPLSLVFPFRFCKTPSRPRKSTSGERPLELFSPCPQKNGSILYSFPNVFNFHIRPFNNQSCIHLNPYGSM